MVEKSYYASRDLKVHWFEAFLTCKAFGMDLVELPITAEAEYFLAQCAHQQIHLQDDFYHVGGSYLGAGSNDWYWMTSGKRVKYTMKFAPGQPDNFNGVEKFLSIFKSPGAFMFNDVDYNFTKWNFFCQHITNSTY